MRKRRGYYPIFPRMVIQKRNSSFKFIFGTNILSTDMNSGKCNRVEIMIGVKKGRYKEGWEFNILL